MQSRSFEKPEDAIQYAKEKHDEGMVALAFQKPDGTAIVNWAEQGTYIAQDGKSYPDEMWVTLSGDIMNISDMSEEHAKNALRLMLRQEREKNDALDKLTGTLAGILDGEDDFMFDKNEAGYDPKYQPVTLDSLLDDSPPPPGTFLN